MSDDRINEIDSQPKNAADNLAAPLDLGDNIEIENFPQQTPETSKSSKGYKYLSIFFIIIIVLDILGYMFVGYNYLRKTTDLFSGFNVHAGYWVSYDENGAYVWKFSDKTCSIDYVEPGGSTKTLFTDTPFYGSHKHVTVNLNTEESRELYYDSEFNCLWEYSYDGDVETRTKLLFFKNYPTDEQNERNIKGYKYLRYNSDSTTGNTVPQTETIPESSSTALITTYNFEINDTVYSLSNMHLYKEKSQSADFGYYIARGDILRIEAIDGDWLGFNCYDTLTDETTICWCRANNVSKTQVPFIPEYTGKPSRYLFEALVEEDHYMRSLIINLLERMMIVNHEDCIPMYDYQYPPRQEVVDSMSNPETNAYTAKGINTIEDIKKLYQNFLTDKCISQEGILDMYSQEYDEGFHIINGKYYFHGFIGGRGWNNRVVKSYQQISPTKWVVETVDYYNRLPDGIYTIVLEGDKYKIDEIKRE